MAAVVTIAVETAMRRSEILRISTQSLRGDGWIHIFESKNRKKPGWFLSLKQLAMPSPPYLKDRVPSPDSVSQAFAEPVKKPLYLESVSMILDTKPYQDCLKEI